MPLGSALHTKLYCDEHIVQRVLMPLIYCSLMVAPVRQSIKESLFSFKCILSNADICITFSHVMLDQNVIFVVKMITVSCIRSRGCVNWSYGVPVS